MEMWAASVGISHTLCTAVFTNSLILHSLLRYTTYAKHLCQSCA